MKADNTPLSSEQALDDYFSSLLGLEESQDEAMVEEHNSDVEALTDAAKAEIEHEETEAILETSEADESDSLEGSDDAQALLGDDLDNDIDLQQEPQSKALDEYDEHSVWDSKSSSDDFQHQVEDESSDDFELPYQPQLQQDEPYMAQAQLANTQPLAQAELAEIEQLPNLENLEKLFSGLQAQVDSEVGTVEADDHSDVAVLEQPLISDSQVESEAEQEIQAWDEQFENQVDSQEAIFEASSTVEAKPEPEVKADLQSADIEPDALITPESDGGGDSVKIWQNGERTQSFQVLYFDVNGVTFAVPLDELGGIHKLTTLSHLIGRPDWYLGLQTSRENQIDVVDTAMWAMPDVLTDEEYKQAYDYVVMLGESQWGLASTALKGTEMLTQDKVRWRETAGKRPWLAGMVKEQMCALVHVSELIGMLNAGLDVKSVQ